MIGKYIECEVDLDQRPRFSKAQESWKATGNSDGFHGQLGGWDSVSSNALVLALWEDEESIDGFMASKHDDIAKASNQQDAYRSCSVELLKCVQRIPSYDGSGANLQADIGFVRIADCRLREGENRRFEDMQKNLWNPGMAACRGMQGGLFWQSLTDHRRYIVVSFWSTEEFHRSYVNKVFPSLRAKASVERSVKDLKGRRVSIEDKWTVIPNKSVHSTLGRHCASAKGE